MGECIQVYHLLDYKPPNNDDKQFIPKREFNKALKTCLPC